MVNICQTSTILCELYTFAISYASTMVITMKHTTVEVQKFDHIVSE